MLPKKLDEEVAALMVEGFGGVITKLTQDQADYINVPQEGPFKEESYKILALNCAIMGIIAHNTHYEPTKNFI